MIKCANTKAAAQEICKNNMDEKRFFLKKNIYLNQELSTIIYTLYISVLSGGQKLAVLQRQLIFGISVLAHKVQMAK